MKTARSFLAGISILTWFFFVPVTFSGQVFLLKSGVRAVVEGKKLMLWNQNSLRAEALPGTYETKDGKHTIIVKSDRVEILTHNNDPQ